MTTDEEELFTIASHIGGLTVLELKERLTIKERSLWRVYLTNYPTLETRLDLNIAHLCSLLANINRDSKKKSSPYEITDFLLKYNTKEDQRYRKDPKEIQMRMNMWAELHNSRIKK